MEIILTAKRQELAGQDLTIIKQNSLVRYPRCTLHHSSMIGCGGDKTVTLLRNVLSLDCSLSRRPAERHK